MTVNFRKMGLTENVRLFLLMTLHMVKYSLLKLLVVPLVSCGHFRAHAFTWLAHMYNYPSVRLSVAGPNIRLEHYKFITTL